MIEWEMLPSDRECVCVLATTTAAGLESVQRLFVRLVRKCVPRVSCMPLEKSFCAARLLRIASAAPRAKVCAESTPACCKQLLRLLRIAVSIAIRAPCA